MPSSAEFNLVASHLNRLEKKMDSLSTAVVTLARVEEQLIGINKTNDSVREELMSAQKRIAELERLTYGRGVFFRWFERIMVIVVTLIIGILGKSVFDRGGP